MNLTSKAIRDEATKFRIDHKHQMTVSPADLSASYDRLADALDKPGVVTIHTEDKPSALLDPFFAGTGAFDLISELSEIQRTEKPNRICLAANASRTHACSGLLAEYSHQIICDAWRWFLTTPTIEDKYRGHSWIDTFFRGFPGYDEASRSKPNTEPRDRPVKFVPPVQPDESAEERAEGEKLWAESRERGWKK